MVLDSGLARRAHRGCGGPPGQVPEYGIVWAALGLSALASHGGSGPPAPGLGDDY